MIERFIHRALTDGVKKINGQPEILDMMFRDLYDMEVREVATIRKAWTERPLSVVHGYPRLDAKFPQVSIVLVSEGESQTYIGDEAGQIEDPDHEFFGADEKSAVWQHQYSLLIVTEHPDLTLYYYQVVKAIVLSATPYFIEQGVHSAQVSGQDLVPDPSYLPDHLWVRQLTFSCQSEFLRVDIDSLAKKAWRLDGIHIDSTGSPSDIGPVKALVTVRIGGSDDGTEEEG